MEKPDYLTDREYEATLNFSKKLAQLKPKILKKRDLKKLPFGKTTQQFADLLATLDDRVSEITPIIEADLEVTVEDMGICQLGFRYNCSKYWIGISQHDLSLSVFKDYENIGIFEQVEDMIRYLKDQS